MRKFFLISGLLCSITFFGQDFNKNTSQNNDIVANYLHLSTKQIFDTAKYYFNDNNYETALALYNLIINLPTKDDDSNQQKNIAKAYNETANIYFALSCYSESYEYYIKALSQCEKNNYLHLMPTIFNNIGAIYHNFKKFDIAKEYYKKALYLSEDSVKMIILLNNLGTAERDYNRIDSAFYYINQSLKISKRHNNIHLDVMLKSIADIYLKLEIYDSAFHYFYLSLDEAKKKNYLLLEAYILSDLGKLFLKVNKTDSALNYINMSYNIAFEKEFSDILADNYLTMSKIEDSKGHSKKAFELFKKYVNLKDSIFGADKFGEINKLQRLYEVSKINQQIEQLFIDKQIKENTIFYQKILLGVLMLLILTFLGNIFQKKKMTKTSKVLVYKNVEIIKNEKKTSEKEKTRKRILTDNAQNELLDKILEVMKNTEVFCDTKFSIIKLAELVQSTDRYVSEVINISLHKNFRSFLNEYRIKEAQNLFMEFDVKKYTIESVSKQVGFKSLNAFYEVFKEVTGVNPGVYVKSIREANMNELYKFY